MWLNKMEPDRVMYAFARLKPGVSIGAGEGADASRSSITH